MTTKQIWALAVGVVATLMAGTAMAGAWSNFVQITNVEVDDTGTGSSTYLTFSSEPTGKPACGTMGQVIAGGSVDNVKSVTALATAALMAGRNVRMYWDGNCVGPYARFVAFSVQ